MEQEDNRSFGRTWKEFWGRRRVMEPIPFDETAIMTQTVTFRVDTPGYYLSLPSMTAAIITSPTGHKQVFTEGGYKELQGGAYTIQYVDLSERFTTLPRIAASTIDGPEVSLTISITYKINDASLIIKVATPLQTLFSVCEAAIKNFIITHRHDELIGEPGNEQIIPDNEIIQYIKGQVAMNQACRAFWVMDVIIKERYGNPEISKLRHERNVLKNKNITTQENLVQQQRIANEQKKLERKNAEKEREILGIRAQSEADQSDILERANRLSIELERLRKLPDMQYGQALEKIKAFEKVLQSLIQAQMTSGFPRDTNQEKLLDSFIRSLAEMQTITPQLPEEHSKPVNELGTTIINLITPKNKGK